MKLFVLIFMFSLNAWSAQKCELSLYKGDDIVKSKVFVIPAANGKAQVFEKLSPRFYEDHEKKYRSTQYSLSRFIEYSGNKIKSVDFIINRKVEEYSIGKLPASLFSQIQNSFPLERISIRLKDGLGKKSHEINSKNSLELSCKNS